MEDIASAVHWDAADVFVEHGLTLRCRTALWVEAWNRSSDHCYGKRA